MVYLVSFLIVLFPAFSIFAFIKCWNRAFADNLDKKTRFKRFVYLLLAAIPMFLTLKIFQIIIDILNGSISLM